MLESIDHRLKNEWIGRRRLHGDRKAKPVPLNRARSINPTTGKQMEKAHEKAVKEKLTSD